MDGYSMFVLGMICGMVVGAAGYMLGEWMANR